MATNGAMSRRQLLKLGVVAGAVTTGALSPVLSGPALAAGPDKQVFFNVVDATGIALIATSGSVSFLAVDVLPSQFVGGVNVTLPSVGVPGPEPGGFWRIEFNQTTVIPIPATGLSYDFSKGGFAAVRAISVDQSGNPGTNDVMCYVALNRPAYMGSVSGTALEGTVFAVAVPTGFRNQVVTLCVTALANVSVLVRDARTNTALLPFSSVNQHHSLIVEAAVDEPTQLLVELFGGGGVCSALIRRGPNRTRRLRLYPTKVA